METGISKQLIWNHKEKAKPTIFQTFTLFLHKTYYFQVHCKLKTDNKLHSHRLLSPSLKSCECQTIIWEAVCWCRWQRHSKETSNQSAIRACLLYDRETASGGYNEEACFPHFLFDHWLISDLDPCYCHVTGFCFFERVAHRAENHKRDSP